MDNAGETEGESNSIYSILTFSHAGKISDFSKNSESNGYKNFKNLYLKIFF